MLVEAPYVPEGLGEHVWLKLYVEYYKVFDRYIFPNQNLFYASSVVVDVETNRMLKTNKHTTGCLDKTLDGEYIQMLLSTATNFVRDDQDWKMSLMPKHKEVSSSYGNIINEKRKTSLVFQEFINKTISSGISSTGLRGNVNVHKPIVDDTECEEC